VETEPIFLDMSHFVTILVIEVNKIMRPTPAQLSYEYSSYSYLISRLYNTYPCSAGVFDTLLRCSAILQYIA
jgi:hypothetical protein